jgi:hypothetical protein
MLSIKEKGCGKWNFCGWENGKNGRKLSMALGGKGDQRIKYPNLIGGVRP